MSKRSSDNYRGSAFPLTGKTAAVLFISVFALAGCLKDGGDDSKCAPVPFTKTITPTKIQGNHDAYFNPGDFDFMFASNTLVTDITFQGVTSGKHDPDDRNDDFSFDVNGTKCSRSDGDRNVNWNCGNGHDDSTHTRFCSPMHKFGLNGGLNVLDFMLLVKLQQGLLRLSAHAPKEPVLSDVSIIVTGETHPTTCTKPPPPPPPPPVAPKTSITAYNPTASPSNSTTKSITFSADQSGVSYSCSLDGATGSACTSPVLYSGLTSGTHTFTVSATNSAGLSDATPPSLTWVVDTLPPTVTITNLASLPTLTNQTSISLQFTASKSGSTFSCALDANAAIACASPYTLSGLSEGTHKIVISAVDSLGNVSANPATFQWAIDVTPPVTTINSVAPVSAINNSTQMTFQFSANETATFACAFDNGAYSVCASPLVQTNVAEGPHWFSVRATDAAGNQGAAVSYSWKADFTPPVVTITGSTPPVGATNAHNLAVNFTVSEPSTVMCSLDGAAAAACTSPFTGSVTTEGEHTLVLTATDAAGNASTGTTISWYMDFTSPILSLGQILPSAANYINSSSLSLEVLASKPVTMSATLNGSSLGTFTSPLTLTNLAEGSYTVVISAYDHVGNQADTLSYSFTVDLTPPSVSLSADITGLTNLDHNTLTFSASETATLACNIDEAGFGACLSPLTLSGLADGVHTVLVHATDLAGNISADQSLTWTVDTTPPLTTVTTTQNAQNSFTFAFGANENSTFQCSLDGAPMQACSSPVTITNQSAGPHNFFVQATDLAGNVDSNGANAAFSIAPPSTTLVSNRTGNNAVSFSFSSNVSPVTFICSIDGAAAATCTAPMSANNLGAGTHSFHVSAVDSAGNVDPNGATFGWTVRAALTTVLSSANPSASLVNVRNMTFNFTSNYSDATFVCSLNGSAAAPCVSPMTYAGVADGPQTFVVKAVDPWGYVDPTGATYNWTVDATAPVTTLTTTQNNLNSFTFTFSANESSTFQCSLDSAPATACTSPVTAANLLAGNHTFFVQAVDLAGNVDATGARATVTATPPSTTLSANRTANNAVTFTFSSNVSPATFLCSVDSGTATVCSSPYSATGLSVAAHTFNVKAKDSAGNIDPVGASYSWTVRPALTTTITGESPSAAFTNVTNETISFTSNYSDATFVCSLNGEAFASCSSPWSISGLSDGSKTFTVRAVDPWGATDQTGASYSWTVDTVAPTVVSITTSSTATAITINWTTNEPSTTKLFWGVSPSTANVVPEDNVYVTSHSVRVTGLNPNTLYTFKPAGTDRAGNVFTGSIGSVRTTH